MYDISNNRCGQANNDVKLAMILHLLMCFIEKYIFK